MIRRLAILSAALCAAGAGLIFGSPDSTTTITIARGSATTPAEIEARPVVTSTTTTTLPVVEEEPVVTTSPAPDPPPATTPRQPEPPCKTAGGPHPTIYASDPPPPPGWCTWLDFDAADHTGEPAPPPYSSWDEMMNSDRKLSFVPSGAWFDMNDPSTYPPS